MTGHASAASARERYARHRQIPGWDQDLLAAATVVIAGVGALGNEVAKNLALAGVGRLVLCDHDIVQPSNLSRSVLFAQQARPGMPGGQPKTQVAAAGLRDLVPGITVEARQADLEAGLGLGELAGAAVVLGCLDSRQSRLRLLGRCALVEAPLVDGGTYPWGGEVRLRLSTDEPCYGCSLTAHQRAESDLPWSCADVSDDHPAGASIASSALIAAWMSTVALRMIFGVPPAYRLVRIDTALGQAMPVTVDRDPACPHHRPIGAAEDTAAGSDSTVDSLLAQVPADAEPLTWTSFVVAGQCSHCGTPRGAVPYRSAENMLCAACGHLVRLPLSQRIRDAAGSLPLRDLGVAPLDILPLSMPKGEFRWLRLTR